MPQSLSNVLIHLVFSTKNRKPALTPEIREELFPYLVGVLNGMASKPLQIGGVTDHIHIIHRLPRTVTVAHVAEKIKTSTTKWIKSKWDIDFAWQSGYAAFSVGSRELDQMISYVANQEVHHRKMSFQEEFRALLEEAGIEYDERYVWD